jgi:S1-C subfamily serine protease
VIVEFEKKPIFSQSELMKIIGECDARSTVSIVVLRSGDRQEFSIVLGKRDSSL